MSRFFNSFAALVILCAAAFLLVCGYWMFWPVRLLEAKQPLHIITTDIQKGKELVYEFDYCRYTTLDALSSRQIICRNRMYILPDVRGNVPPGCAKGRRSIFLPSEMDPDTCFVHFSSTFVVNPLRTVTLLFDTESFVIRK